MKFSSIFYTITLIFIIATTSIFLAFLWLMDYDKQNYTRELNTKYSVVARATLLHMNDLINKEEYL
ncbi:MAG: sensor histidine kinase, partial [Campylobacter hyointestinalis]